MYFNEFLQRPGHDGQLQRQHLLRMQEKMSDSEDGDSDYDDLEINDTSAILNLNPAYGQTIALWSFRKHDSIAIFPPINDLMSRVVEYAEQHLGFLRYEHKLMLLSPGQQSPVDLKSVHSIRPGAVVMVMPEPNVHLTIEINQLKTSFTLTVDLAMTVHRIKTFVRKRKGIPVERQEILYSNKALDNDKRLLEYRVKSRSTLYIMIQAHFDLLINVETFWGKIYRFYLDPCSTGTDIVYAVFNRAFSSNGPEDVGLHELYVPIHILVLQYQNKFVNWDYCIAYLGIHTGETLMLTTVGHQSNMKLETVNVVTESGEKYEVTVSRYDRWSVLAFMLHGLTNVPVDLIRLYKNGKRVDFSSIIGQIGKSHVVVMNVVMTHMDSDLVFGVPLKLSIGNGIIENVRISANKTVRHLKRKLEKMGVPNATLYELTIDNQKLPNSSKIMDLVSDLKIPLVLKLETYPVFAHAPDGVIYKTYLKANQTLGDFKRKIELKTGYSLKSSRLLIAGQELVEHPHSVLYDSGVSCRNSIFFKYTHDMESFFVVGNNWLEKIRLPLKPTSTDIRNAVWNARKLSEGSLNCVLTILYWFFMPRLDGQTKTRSNIKIRQRMPVAREKLYELKNNVKPQYLDRELLEKHNSRASYASPYHGENKSWPRSSSKVGHHIKTDNIPKFEPDQYIDPKEIIQTTGRENCHRRAVDLEMTEAPRSTIPSWMRNLQTRNKTNRLLMADVEGGPDGMASVRQSRTHQFRKINNARMTHIPNNLNHARVTYRAANQNDNFSKRNRFMYNHQHFDFVTSDDGHDDQSETQYPLNFLPKL